MKTGHERPVNRTAAAVVSRGETFNYRALSTSTDSPLPLATRELSEGETDLRGVKFGRLTALGPAANKTKRWVCRCACGCYLLRKTTVILAAAEDAACDQCYLMAVSKRNEMRERTGKEIHTKEFLR